MHWSLIILLKIQGDNVAKKPPEQLLQFKEHAVTSLEDRVMCL